MVPIRPAARLTLLAAGLLLVVACGGGGGLALPEPLPVVDLGVQASTVPSRTELSFPNPLSSAATVTAGPAEGPFSLDPADLPAAAPQDGAARIGVLFSPQGDGPVDGTVTLVFAGTTGTVEQTWEVRATGEVVTWGILTPTLDFGGVEVGESRDLAASILNASTFSPVTITSATVPAGGFSIVDDPFPLTVEPGEAASVTLRYEPLTGAFHDGTLRLGPSDPGGPIAIEVLAEGLGAGTEVVTDYGNVSIDGNGRTTVLSVSVPDDAISLYLEGSASGGFLQNVVGLYSLTGPGGKVYENTSSTGDYIWLAGYDVFSTQIPNTDQPGVQLVPGGGTYQFRLRLLNGLASSIHVRAIVERRDPGSEGSGSLPLNVYLADGLDVSAATAASDTFLQQVLSRIDGILSTQGITLGDIDYYDVTDAAYDEIHTESEFYDLLETSSMATETRLNLYFVELALGGGVVGVSATICGPRANGTPLSGVMSVYGGFSSNTIGLIAAHELGHFLGLYHTAEQNGDNDFIDDTLECPATGTDEVCSVAGGGYLMHWQAVGGSDLTDGQGQVLRGHPHIDVAAEGSTKPRMARPAPLDATSLAEILALPEGWCGTCRGRKDRRDP